jgi:hypothetical protein
MTDKPIRIGQLIAPFGPGSLYTDRRGIPHVVCGLDYWYMKHEAAKGMVACSDVAEFEILESRLSELLHVERFRSPPDYRRIRRGDDPPPNAALAIPALRFPTWYRHTSTGEMRRFNPDSARLPPAAGGRWQPVRFISVCAGGHLNEFPWQEWIDCTCSGQGGLRIIDRGGADLASIQVLCKTCPPGSDGARGKSLSGTTSPPDKQGDADGAGGRKGRSAFEKAGIACPGERPWLGPGAEECNCPHPLVGALINQTNLYFPRTVAAILLPEMNINDEAARARAELAKDPAYCVPKRMEWKLVSESEHSRIAEDVQRYLARRGHEFDVTAVQEALRSLFEPRFNVDDGAAVPAAPESELQTFRRQEFNVIRQKIDDPDRMPDLRVIPSEVPDDLDGIVARVNLVERLRETRAFHGFSRLEPQTVPPSEMPDAAIRQLFRHPPADMTDRWLPAVAVFGEGIYLELSEDRLCEWQQQNQSWLADRLSNDFILRLSSLPQAMASEGVASREWASRFLLVHSLAHVLINQLVFECGYSAASLRERLYISSDPAAPMAGILIYTSAGDSEGTMGGLVRLGQPERFGAIVRRAISRASWCSADPVCSENLGGQGSRQVNLAACHSCVLLPETSCETINQGLDRAMLVGTPEDRSPGYLSELVETYMVD